LNVWFKLFPTLELQALFDAPTVRHLKLFMPQYSTFDQLKIKNMIRQDYLFPALGNYAQRCKIFERLLKIQGRIPSLRAFFEDIIFFELYNRAFRGFLPIKFKGFVKNAFMRKYSVSEKRDDIVCVQISEIDFAKHALTNGFFTNKEAARATLLYL
jgi:hypothetical protein